MPGDEGAEAPLGDEVLGAHGAEPEDESERPKRRRRPLLIALVSVLVLVVLAAVGIGGFTAYLSHTLDSNVRRTHLLPDGGNRVAPAPEAGSAMNILLLGSDSRTEELRDSARADVIQLVHIPDDRRSIQVVHFPRDLYVDIPGRGKNKINAAYAFGGAPLLVQTLEGMLGVRIDHVAAIGFDGFKAITNTMGGVDVQVDQPSVSGGYTFTPGRMHLNGDQALAFVRERKQLKVGDIDRGKRQQAWIKGLVSKVLSRGTLANPLTVSSLVSDTSKNLIVDDSFSTAKIRSLAFSLRNVRSGGVTFLTAPYSGFRSVPGVGSVDVVDERGMQQLGAALRSDRMERLPGQTSNPG